MTAQFDFISDAEFRSTLAADYEEMLSCSKTGAWKAVHVLAGSIIEAVIVDYLIAENIVSRGKGLKLFLNGAIDMAADSEILPEDIRNLSVVVKDYRNLVHPGRSIRLQKKPDQNSSNVAASLVNMICSELANRKGSRGYTADQIVSKVRADYSVGAILQDLLQEVPEQEIRELLINSIPVMHHQEVENQSRYREDDVTRYRHVLPTLKSLFRIAYKHAEVETQQAVALHFVQILKEAPSDVVTEYGETFWWMGQMDHLAPDDIQIVTKHLLSRLRKEYENPDLVKALPGIVKFLSTEDAILLVLGLQISMVFGREDVADAASKVMHGEYLAVDADIQSRMMKRLDEVHQYFVEEGQDDYASVVTRQKALLEIPF